MQSCLSSYEGSWKAFMTTISQGASADAEAALSGALSDGAVITAAASSAPTTADTYWPALYAKAAGTPMAQPTWSSAPHRGGRGRAVLGSPRRAARAGRPLGRRVGHAGRGIRIDGGIVLDMRSLDAVIEIDEVVDDRHRPGRQERASGWRPSSTPAG